jgi:ribonuclease D
MEEYQYTISKDEINDYELGSFDGDVVIVEDIQTAESVIKKLSFCTVLGFDTESKPSFRKGEHHPISLIQLSTENKAYLFRINKMEEKPDFSSIFSNTEIVKVGLGIKDELIELEKALQTECNYFIDLEKVANYHKFHQRGVRALAAFFLKIRISKSAQKSNWERNELTEQQQKYAATDAWVCLMIYNSMTEKNFLPLENEEDMYILIKRKEKLKLNSVK